MENHLTTGDPAAQAGAVEWPDVVLPVALWPAYCEAARGALAAGEVYIAHAIAAGVVPAIAAFERRYFSVIDAALHRAGATGADVDDVKQTLRVRLFVATAGQPAIVGYAGRGQLAGLLRVSAIRAYVDLRAKQPNQIADEAALTVAIAADLELPSALAAVHDGARIKQALAASIAGLPRDARVVLRMQIIHGLGIDRIAAMLGIHRATAARRVIRAREELVERVRAMLVQKLGSDELDILTSHVQVSLERLLAHTVSGPA